MSKEWRVKTGRGGGYNGDKGGARVIKEVGSVGSRLRGMNVGGDGGREERD